MIAHIQHIFALRANQTCEDVTGATGVYVLFLEGARVDADTEGAGFSVDLTEDCALAEEKGFSGVYDDSVEIGFPVSVGLFRLEKKIYLMLYKFLSPINFLLYVFLLCFIFLKNNKYIIKIY